jgi:TPR repeat protein
MNELVRDAAAKDHPDAIWFLVTGQTHPRETNPDFERLLLRAGQLGSVNAQRELGVMYATGDWSGPKDLAEAARWYRLAAEKGNAESQYDPGFMLLLGEGAPKDNEEGVMWLARAGELGEYKAFRLLVDCYENGYCDVPVDAAKAALWRGRMEEYQGLHPPSSSRRYSVDGAVDNSSLECLWNIEGVIGLTFMTPDNQFSVAYEPALITPGQLDERIRAAGLSALPAD